MNVKYETKPLDRIQQVLRDQNGILYTADLANLGIPRTYLSILVKRGAIQQVARGIYSTPSEFVDEMACIQSKYKNAIFSHETALYLLGLSDRTPLFYSVTVPTGYNARRLKANGIKVYFVKREYCSLGVTFLKSPHGNELRVFDLERTLCDVIRSRNQLDTQFVYETLKKYVADPRKNLNQLNEYAKQFGVQKILRLYIEVLL